MNKIILTFFLAISSSVFSQNYEKSWDKVIRYENEGKIKSAFTELETIYKRANSNKNEVQTIKCFFYKSKFLQTLEENAQVKIIANLQDEISKVSIPSKSILTLVYAKSLKSYLNQNLNKIYNRTKIDSTQTGNLLTWTSDDFDTVIQDCYTKTLSEEVILKNTPLKNYEPIFEYFNNEEFNASSLYDYLASENIDFYTSKIHGWELSHFMKLKISSNFLESDELFKKNVIDTIKDEAVKKVLGMYQKINSYKKSTKTEFKRLLFCNEYLTKNNPLLLKKLDDLQRRSNDTLLIEKIQFEKANLYNQLASKESFPNYRIKAVVILDSILRSNYQSNTFKRARAFKNSLALKSLQLNMLQYSYEKENTRASVTYKNIDSFRVSFYKINSKILGRNLSRDSIISILKTEKTPYKSQIYKLLNKYDYFDYSTEVLLPQLEIGNYVVIIDKATTNNQLEDINYQFITVSNTCILLSQKDETIIFQTLDRKTGKPISNCKIQNDKIDLVTNEKGIAKFKIDTSKNNTYYSYSTFDVIKNNDTLVANTNYIYYNENKNVNKPSFKVNFYLDRAIYKPGQPVYFKGIVTQKKDGEYSVIPNLLIKVNLLDDNDDELKTFEFTTNEFGSFAGEYLLPKNVLTGNFSIEADEPDDIEKDTLYDRVTKKHLIWDNEDFEHSSIKFKVEEYKRPKFEVVFEPTKENYLIRQNIVVKGNAKAFMGSNIADAKVVYRVEQNLNYSKSHVFYPDYKTLFSSETKTDNSGNFTIRFDAIPDEENLLDDNIILSYKIQADVTDCNGETHSNQTYVNVGNHYLIIDAVLPQKISTDKKNILYLKSTNLNKQFIPIEGEVKIYFIKEFKNKFKPRIFQSQPEITTISKEQFEQLFPYEDNENSEKEDSVGTLVYSKKVNTEKNKSIEMDFISDYKSGYYKIVFSTLDQLNNPVEKKSYFKLFQSKDKKANGNELFTLQQINKDPIKDGYLKMLVKCAVPKAYVFFSVIYYGETYYEDDTTINDYQSIITIPITKDMKRSFKFAVESVFENHYFKSEAEILIAEIQPKITFEVMSFRDKLEPGKPENWSFKIKENNKKVEAEILASMYDSSLDQFATKGWNSLIEKQRHNNYNHKSLLTFNTIYLALQTNQSRYEIESKNESTQLIWFGFNINDSKINEDEYHRQLSKKAKKPLNAKLVYGIVRDKNGPLPGTYIGVKGTTRNVAADVDGYYEIEVAPNEQLRFFFEGYKAKTYAVGASKTLNVTLNETGKMLEEVVVTSLSIKKREGAITSSNQIIKAQELEQSPSILEALKGKVSGLQITTNKASNTTKIIIRGNKSLSENSIPLIVVDGVISNANLLSELSSDDLADVNVLKGAQGTALYGSEGVNGVLIITTKKGIQELTTVKARTNLSETAFFFPQLKVSSNGTVNFNFNSPEALTKWKLRLLAHTKKANLGYLEKSIITQKELMVIPNLPRFLREKDTITIISKISNLTSKTKTGIAVLQLYDASTMINIDAKMMNSNSVKNFTILPSGNSIVKWKITIPEGLLGLQYKIVAKADDYSDGEESILPVLTNTQLVTESIPVWIRGNSKKEYVFDNLKNNTSSTLRNHLFTFEYTSNPTWIAIQSLPYLMEYEHECAEQTFARYYAAVMASEIINKNPKIKTLFEDWKKSGKSISKLEQNEELKSIIFAETPWLKDVESEEEKKKQIGLLFDLENMKALLEGTLKKLKGKQTSNGAFAWFDGGEENEYITRHIVAGLGHLQKLKIDNKIISTFSDIIKTAIPYLDSKFNQTNKYYYANNQSADLHYLYTRSFYLDSIPISNLLKIKIDKNLDYIKNNWLKLPLYSKAMASLVLNRFNEKESAKKILVNLKESASNNEDWGMYWIENKAGYNWDESPIETQALIIEAFIEIDNDMKSADAMKVWLLKNKQTKSWPTTKSTTEAIYALLMQGSEWLSVKDNTIIKIGNEKIVTKKLSDNEKEAATGYIKMNWKSDEIKTEMATIVVENKSKVPSYGGIYWQYFEDLDKIKSNIGSVLSTYKELYLKKNEENGEKLQKINSATELQIGDLITVRLIITAKENMEYVHLKDMRASCFEPLNVLSKYQWKDGLGFYMSTRDAATHFFFDQIDKGTYALEYEVRVTNSGNFSNGITTIESMYAPEFTSHTKGIRVQVKD